MVVIITSFEKKMIINLILVFPLKVEINRFHFWNVDWKDAFTMMRHSVCGGTIHRTLTKRGRSICQAIWKCKLSTWNKQLEEAERNPYQGMAYSLRDKLSSRRKQRLQFSLSLEICCHIPYMGFFGLGFVNISIISSIFTSGYASRALQEYIYVPWVQVTIRAYWLCKDNSETKTLMVNM